MDRVSNMMDGNTTSDLVYNIRNGRKFALHFMGLHTRSADEIYPDRDTYQDLLGDPKEVDLLKQEILVEDLLIGISEVSYNDEFGIRRRG